MRKAFLVTLLILAIASLVMAQTAVSPTDVLGAHQNQGRGCAGCHAPHSGAFGSGHVPKGSASDAGSYALWGQDASPLYGATLAFGDSGKYVEVLPGSISSGTTEVSGILLCLSCHDGNVTYSNMMTNHSYEQAIGLLTNTTYGSNPIPTLLGNDGTGTGNYTNDHPVGLNANISSGSGLVWANNVFTVTAGSQYAQFVANYGWPALAPGAWSSYPYGVTPGGKPYVACTTCHDQHNMTVYTSTSSSPIAGNTAGYFTKLFFIRGPYNPNNQNLASKTQAYSTTQFCRQCHFSESNEANNTNNITTLF